MLSSPLTPIILFSLGVARALDKTYVPCGFDKTLEYSRVKAITTSVRSRISLWVIKLPNRHGNYITLDDIFGDTDGDDNDGGYPEDAEFFDVMQLHLNKSGDLLYGNPMWLDNFAEMKKAAKQPIYEVVH